MSEKARATPVRAFALFMLVMLLLLTFPIYGLANRIEPFVLGLPFSMAWVVFWIIVEFFVLLGFIIYEFGSGRA